MVGGRNYGVSQFNRITQARRQPGSAFKPFVFLSALDLVTPVTWLANVAKSYEVDGKVWEPENVEPIAETRVTVRRALAKSINLATIELAMQIGLKGVVETARSFQFSTPLKPYPSIALGAFELVPLELARAYCAFAADGVLPNPLSVKEVVGEAGQVLERRHMTIARVTTPAKAFLMSSLLRSVVTEGTARGLQEGGIDFPAAGKTGTTNDFKDAWFVGYTPDVLALVWVGFDNNDPVRATGAAAAMPIWAELMKAIPEHVSEEWFRVPPGVVQRVVCLDSGELAVPEVCPAPREEFFLETNAPVRSCTLHQVGPFKKLMKGIKDVFTK
jgi:penicillin-binding protein 1B